MSKAIPSRVNYLLNVKHLLACFEAMPRFAVIASVLLKPGSSSPGWVHQCPQNLWDLIPHSAWQSCSCPWWEPTLAWAPGAEALVSSQVVEEELQSFPRRLEEQQDTYPTSPRVAAHQEPWSGKCSPILHLGMPTSPWAKGLSQWALANWIALRCERNVVCTARSGWRSLKQLQIVWVWAASPHTLESLLTKISWILLI